MILLILFNSIGPIIVGPPSHKPRSVQNTNHRVPYQDPLETIRHEASNGWNSSGAGESPAAGHLISLSPNAPSMPHSCNGVGSRRKCMQALRVSNARIKTWWLKPSYREIESRSRGRKDGKCGHSITTYLNVLHIGLYRG